MRSIPATLRRLAFLVAIVSGQSAAADEPVMIFEDALVEYDADLADAPIPDGYARRRHGQIVETTVDLPALPVDQRDAKRITVSIDVDPVIVEKGGRRRPGDPWTRIGSLSVVLPDESDDQEIEVELARFMTGFGGQARFDADLTALAPLLTGDVTFRLFISTYSQPAWRVSVAMSFMAEGVGYRRPALAEPLWFESAVSSAQSTLRASIKIPPGMGPPRLRVLTTGHASDGRGGDEFVTRTHVLRVDGKEIARWRPWCEAGGPLRPSNPASGRVMIGDRELWSSDLDRSGWSPGLVVDPLMIPLPELTPGGHRLELEIRGIRPPDEEGAFGYWRVSAMVLADEPWPEDE